MRVKITILICITILIWGLNKVDYVTNAFMGNPGYGLMDSIKTDVETLFKKIQKK